MNATKPIWHFTVIIKREGDRYASFCPEVNLASEGTSVEEAKQNLAAALEQFFAVASPSEIRDRLSSEVFVTYVEIAVG